MAPGGKITGNHQKERENRKSEDDSEERKNGDNWAKLVRPGAGVQGHGEAIQQSQGISPQALSPPTTTRGPVRGGTGEEIQ